MSEELRRALSDPGYTPPRRAFSEMFALLANPELSDRAEKALLSAGLPAATYAAERLDRSEPAEDEALLRLVGRALRAHDAPDLLAALLKALRSPRIEKRRLAAVALGKSGRRDAETALLECLSTSDVKLLRSVVEALGKVGGPNALSALGKLEVGPNLRQVIERARVMLERTTERTAEGAVVNALDAPLPCALPITLSCRAGLADLLRDEAAPFEAERRGSTEVRLVYGGALRPLLGLRLSLGLALEWPLDETTPSAVLNALLKPDLAQAMQAWTIGPLRFRLVWDGSGHRRADTWRVAQGLRQAGSPLKNDPTEAPWVVRVASGEPHRLLISPVAHPELRFAYRTRDVPAASHPTLAAALARLSGARADDVVWDPFAGSGVELIERALLGPYRELYASDLEPKALAAAAENFRGANIAGVHLAQADARSHKVPGLSLVLSNPPMGRRVLRASGLSGLLCQVVRNVASQLRPEGRMVWLSPFPDVTARAAADAKLAVERLGAVDLGGFNAELQRFVRR